MKKLLSVLLMSMSCVSVAMDKGSNYILQRHASEPKLIVFPKEKMPRKSQSDSFIIKYKKPSLDDLHAYQKSKSAQKIISKNRARSLSIPVLFFRHRDVLRSHKEEMNKIFKSDSLIFNHQAFSPDHWHTYPDLRRERKIIYKKRIRCMQKALREEK